MSKKAFLSLIGVALFSFIFISACENPENSLEESVAPYLELQAVEGASNASIQVNRGEAKGLDSYFAISLSNINSGGLVSEGLSEGWCLDWSKPIRQNNDIHAGIKMFNTHGSDNWKPANYLMNIKDDLKAEDPTITYREIQVALWSLIEEPAFNIDKALRDGSMPSRMMTNGSPNFNVEKTKQIVNRVRSNVSEFEYKPGTPVIVYSKTSNDEQPVGGVFGETAWAYSPNSDGSVNSTISTEFCNNGDFQGNRWGWTNGTYSSNSNPVTLDLIAGAGQCDINKGEFVGTFTFTYENGVLNYTLNLSKNNDFSELHIYAGNDKLTLHKNGTYKTAPGNLGYTKQISSGIGVTTGQINDLSDSIYVAVHLGADEDGNEEEDD